MLGGGGINYFEKYDIPDVLVEYITTFFWGDVKTSERWQQTCRKNRNLCLSKMTTLKEWWDECQASPFCEEDYVN